MIQNDVKKNDKSWAQIFNDFNILSKIEKDGFFEISSKEINKYRESRLMTKFDHKANLPKLFKDNLLSILPLTRGSYIIGAFDAYSELNYQKQNVISVNFPDEIESIDPSNIYSESVALNVAHLCRMIDDLLQEESVLTINGRMSSSCFDFSINGQRGKLQVKVNNSQCEIDGGYESENKLLLLEAKNIAPTDFLIRQLYYPFRLWLDKTQKEVIPAYMTFSNDVFTFFVYQFENPFEYNSLRLIEQKSFTIGAEPISLDDIINVLTTVRIIKEPTIPFPQADNFERIVDLLSLLMVEDLTSDEITINYDFTSRQTFYYTDAAIYLGLVEKKRIKDRTLHSLTQKGKVIMAKKHKEKNLDITRQILEHEVMNKTLRRYLEKASPLENEEVVEIMKSCYVHNVKSENTYERRAQTVSSWINWILNLQSENV